jgi:hypothetical protein
MKYHRLAYLGCVLVLHWLTATGPLRAQDLQSTTSARPSDAEGLREFENRIAPLIAQHCLECHDTATKEGGLDLSRRVAALAGGGSGKVIVPGNAAESLLWQLVADGQMPQDRKPLAPDQKQQLREWIDAGASWSVEVIEPVAPVRAPRFADHVVRRLTVPEYIETVRSAVGINIEHDARRILPPDLRADGFSNTAYNLNVDLEHVQAYAELAEIAVGRMDVPAFARRFTQSQKLTDENLRTLISKMGKWLLRGPLEDAEIDAFLRISSSVAAERAGFEEAVSCIIEAMLQSPRFIYRIEKQRGDGTDPRISDYELAARLSYIVWGGPPDEELMRAADSGELSDRNALEAQVTRMLQDARAVERSAQFICEWLDLDRLINLKPNQNRFPEWDEQLAADMRTETLAFFQHVVWEQKRPLSELMNAQVTYLTPRLAAHYVLDGNSEDTSSEAPSQRRIRHLTPDTRHLDGLAALYTFQDGGGDTVHDVSGNDEPLDLTIADPTAVRWTEDGLSIESPTLIASSTPPNRLSAAVKSSNSITLEAWVAPADTNQSGPARILSLSSGTIQRNFTLGQDTDRFDVRLRSTRTDANGLPSLASPQGSVELRPTHVAFTRDATGRTKLYIDGELKATGHADGDLSNWDESFTLTLANESTRDRPWRGTLSLVAIYSRALSPEEIQSRCQLLSRYDLMQVPSRGGLLTHASVLTVGGDEASMVARGLFVLRDLLYAEVGDPPPCVDTTPVPTKPGQSQRAIAEVRLADASCAGCHSKFEPLAFALEKFDGIGAYHEVDEHGNKLRDDGQIHFPGASEPISYQSSREFMNLLAGSERVKKNFTRKVTQFAVGRPLVAADEPVIEEIHQAAEKGGGTYTSLITAIVMSDLVRMAPTEKNP